MTLLYLLSWIALLLQVVFLTVAIAAALYYLAELVEEYTSTARRVIMCMISSTTLVYVLFIFFDDLPWRMVLCGLIAQAFHFAIMRSFPFIRFLSFSFIGAIALLLVNHVLAFQYFTSYYFTFVEVLSYFTLCLWMVPFALFVSLSANDNVLPTVNEDSMMHRGSHDVVTNYFARGKKQGLLSLFNYAKDTLLPARSKKSF